MSALEQLRVAGITGTGCTLNAAEARETLALHAENATQRLALENVRMLAMRMRRTDAVNAEHLLRFCHEAGVVGSVLRGGSQ